MIVCNCGNVISTIGGQLPGACTVMRLTPAMETFCKVDAIKRTSVSVARDATRAFLPSAISRHFSGKSATSCEGLLADPRGRRRDCGRSVARRRPSVLSEPRLRTQSGVSRPGPVPPSPCSVTQHTMNERVKSFLCTEHYNVLSKM